MRLLSLFIMMMLAFTGATVRGQQKITSHPGEIKGAVRDSTSNLLMKSATASVYKNDDNSLISFQITNNDGEFSFKNLPVGVPLKLEISHVGYQGIKKLFTIPSNTKEIDFKTLIISTSNALLREVVVSVPPITVNGDTLEFNAAAFKLDSNSVVEDLLKKIPNISVWGDGVIIVNGREMKSILVNGKPFFGGNAKIATQNIPKNAVEKIQVYNTANDQGNQMDSIMEMNIKLKKGKDVGYFGKISLGYGTDKRYEADLSINAFTPKMQLAIVGARNNTNKFTNSVSELMINSTFKGTGTNISYQPDFRVNGLTRSTTGGVNFIYNFIEKPTLNDKEILSANYFVQHKNYDNLSNAETTTIINNTSYFDKNTIKSNSSNLSNSFDSRFEWSKKNKSFILYQSFLTSYIEANNELFKSTENEQKILTSTSSNIGTSSDKKNSFNLTANFRITNDAIKKRQKFKGLNASYKLHVDNGNSERLNIVDFRSFTDPSSDNKFNRRYNIQMNEVEQQLNVEITDLKTLIFGKAKLAGIDISINNSVKLKMEKDKDLIEDFDDTIAIYEQNLYLSNLTRVSTVEEIPGLLLSRIFRRGLSNRFNQTWTMNANAKHFFQFQNNQSEKSFQNIKRSYSLFIPDASLSFSDDQYGEYSRTYTLKYTTSVRIPTLSQLAPLIDSTNIYNIFKGNFNLKESETRSLTFSFSNSNLRKKNPLNYNFNISGGITNRQIVDSTFITDDNRRIIYLINRDGGKFMNFYGSVRKPIKLETAELQIELTSNISMTKNPGYMNSFFFFSKNLNTTTNLSFNYTYKDYFAIEGRQSYSTYRSIQEVFNARYNGANIASTISSAYNVTKKVSLNSNITFNQSKYANNKMINFTIWNANLNYRFLKGNNAEIKLSALDLLRNNNNIVNFSNTNSFTIGTQNVLRNYFMCTISYYPRQFGKKEKKL